MFHLKNSLTFRANANPDKCKKRGTKHEKSDAKYLAIYFLFFAFRECFHIFQDECIASLTIFFEKSNIFRENGEKTSLNIVVRESFKVLCPVCEIF